MLRYFLSTLLLAVFLLPLNALALQSEWHTEDQLSSQILVQGLTKSNAGQSYLAGMNFKLEPGWKIYWRHSGDAGAPVNLELLQDSKNIKSVEVKWPAPHRSVDIGDLESFGYKKEVIIPFYITPEDASKPTHAHLQVNLATCKDICLFYTHEYNLQLDPKKIDSDAGALISKHIKRVPKANGTGGVSVHNVAADAETLSIFVKSPKQLHDLDIFVETKDTFRFPKPTVTEQETTQGYEYIVTFNYQTLVQSETLDGKEATLTVVSKNHAIESMVEISFKPGEMFSSKPVKPTAKEMVNSPSFFLILMFAFLGGLILNVMPCVLPVLSIKLMGVLSHGGAKASSIRVSFIYSALGILTSFVALSAIVIALKSAGQAVGWGFHFQQPYFLLALMFILALFTANMWGWFEIMLPYKLTNKLSEASDQTHGNMHHFFTGCLATLLATPCTAPFVTPAVTYALSQDNIVILAIFIALGLGLAAPYLLIAAYPKLVGFMPKPGRWMLKVKAVMGLFLLATIGWLLFVLNSQLGMVIASIVTAIVLVILSLLYIRQYTTRKTPRLVTLLVVLGLLTYGFLTPYLYKSGTAYHVSGKQEIIDWQAFDSKAIPALVEAGKIVYVDVTADWCITCKFNKANILNSDMISGILNQGNVVPMKADYTKPSAEIRTFLEKYNRYGIPFNIVYGPGKKEGVILPEILTTTAVTNAINQAKGK